MNDNTTRFEGLAGAYDRHRPSYPPSLFTSAIERCPPEADRAIDVAAGTGISTALLLACSPSHWRITALEPGADMRRILMERFKSESRVDIVDGTAEAMKVGDAIFGLITVCTAFHWFDADRFMSEAWRVLAPGGVLCVVSYVWGKQPVTEAFNKYLFQEEIAYFNTIESRQSTHEYVLNTAAGFSDLNRHHARSSQELAADEFIRVWLTRSPARSLIEKHGRSTVEDNLYAIYRAHLGSAPMVLDYDYFALSVIKA